jgi:hypothetical protein
MRIPAASGPRLRFTLNRRLITPRIVRKLKLFCARLRFCLSVLQIFSAQITLLQGSGDDV